LVRGKIDFAEQEQEPDDDESHREHEQDGDGQGNVEDDELADEQCHDDEAHRECAHDARTDGPVDQCDAAPQHHRLAPQQRALFVVLRLRNAPLDDACAIDDTCETRR